MTVRDLCGIALADGGMIIDAFDYSIQDLMEIALVSSDRSVIIVKNASKFDAQTLETIVYAAEAKMIFDFTR